MLPLVRTGVHADVCGGMKKWLVGTARVQVLHTRVLSIALILFLLTPLVHALEPPDEGVPSSVAPKPQAPDPTVDEEEAERKEAAREVKQAEHQRILGILPNFNSSSVQHAVKLSPKQKIELATKTALDPYTFAVAAIDGAVSHADNDFPGYGQGLQGYAKRFGAAYADSFDGTLIGNAFLPILFREDPRYFRKGSGSISSRIFYALSTTVRAKSDTGRWVPNYANVLGNIAAGGISNIYYPASDRGVGLTFQRAFTVTAEGSLGAMLVEFWPDIARYYKRRHARSTNN